MSDKYKSPCNEDLYIHANGDDTFDVSVNFACFLHDYSEQELVDYFEECIRITRELGSKKEA